MIAADHAHAATHHAARGSTAEALVRHGDLVCGLAVGLLGATLGVLILRTSGILFFYQNFTPEVIYSACGHGFVRPDEITGALKEFLLVRTAQFDCTLLDPTATGAMGLFARVQLYLSLSVAALWRPPTLRYTDLWPLVAVLTGLYAAGSFVLLRLFFPRALALLGGMVLAASPVTLAIVPSLRDYSKAPFFVWALVFVVLAMRAGSWRSGAMWGALAGCAIGIGYGFRTDLIILVPTSVLALLATLNLRDLARRAGAAAALVAAMLVATAPAITLNVSGGMPLLQGMSEPFRTYLALDAAPYSLGDRYSDELTLSSIAAAERPGRPHWDADEPPALYGVSQAYQLSTRHVLGWLHLFLGDMATQGLKSAAWIVAFPAFTGHALLDPAGPVTYVPGVGRILAPVYEPLATQWLLLLTVPGLGVFLWREASGRPRQFFGVAVLLGLLLAYPVVQFSIRHIFHLEFVWVASLLALLAAPFEWDRLKRVGRWFPILLLGVALAAALIYAGLLAYQERALRAAFEALLSLPRTPVPAPMHVVEDADGRRGAFAVPIPPEHLPLVNAAADSLTDAMPVMGLQSDVRAAADRLLLTLEGCPPGDYRLRVGYDKEQRVWQPFDHEMRLSGGGGAAGSVFLIPAFYRPTQHLARITIEPLPPGCGARLERVDGATSLPPLLTAVLPPDWRDKPLRKGFGSFAAPP